LNLYTEVEVTNMNVRANIYPWLCRFCWRNYPTGHCIVIDPITIKSVCYICSNWQPIGREY